MIKLEIEKKPKLLARYGLCMALISTVEHLLLSAIATKKILPRSEVQTKLYGKTLGGLIKQANNIFDKDFIKKLNQLNEQRIVLAHGLVIERKIFNKSKDGKTNVRKFTLGQMNQTIKEARKLGNKLMNYIKNLIK